MNATLKYYPIYLGLFAVEILALTCNIFLDIKYGRFTAEVIFWSLGIAYSLRVGWRQSKKTSSYGNKRKNRLLIFSLFLLVFIFVPMWGFPRAGIYFIGMLQIAYNCTTTTSRHLQLNLLISLVIVIFATSHYRADWSMLFYLIPYIVAVVFTLVAEQLNHKKEDIQLYSLNKQLIGAQSFAIVATCLMIIITGILLYLITPQVIWPSTSSQWGSPTQFSSQNKKNESSSSGNSSIQNGEGFSNGIKILENEWPTAMQMRDVARRQGMPEWQSRAIYALANSLESYNNHIKPIVISILDWWQVLKEWLKNNLQNIIIMLFMLILLALLFGIWALQREAKTTLWLLTRLDYLRLGIFAMHSSGKQGIFQYYNAIEKLFCLYDMERSKFNNAQEFLRQISAERKDLKSSFSELTLLFEDSQYGNQMSKVQNTEQVRLLYRDIYKSIDVL